MGDDGPEIEGEEDEEEDGEKAPATEKVDKWEMRVFLLVVTLHLLKKSFVFFILYITFIFYIILLKVEAQQGLYQIIYVQINISTHSCFLKQNVVLG